MIKIGDKQALTVLHAIDLADEQGIVEFEVPTGVVYAKIDGKWRVDHGETERRAKGYQLPS